MARVTVFIGKRELSGPGVLDKGIDLLFDVRRPNNGTKNLLNSRRERTVVRARKIAPYRSGNLANSHYSTPAVQSSPRRISATVVNYAPYANHVHEGTRGTSGPNAWDGWGPWAGKHYYFRDGVNGQDANPWLARAYNEVARTSTPTTIFRRMEESKYKAPRTKNLRRYI